MERTVRKPRNIAMTLASVLLCLVLISSYLAAGMLAKYTSGDGGAQIARVAKFAFSVSDTDASHQIIDLSSIQKPGDSKTYDFSVSSGSEVAVSYDITLALSGNMPLTCTVTKNESGGSSTNVLSAVMPGDGNGTSQTKHDAGVFPAASTTSDSYVLTVDWPSTENDIAFASAGSAAEVKLIVTGVQVD